MLAQQNAGTSTHICERQTIRVSVKELQKIVTQQEFAELEKTTEGGEDGRLGYVMPEAQQTIPPKQTRGITVQKTFGSPRAALSEDFRLLTLNTEATLDWYLDDSGEGYRSEIVTLWNLQGIANKRGHSISVISNSAELLYTVDPEMQDDALRNSAAASY